MLKTDFSLQRTWAMMLKEFIQMRRDRVTFAMIIGIPLIQLILFGFAINSNPKHLPTALIAADKSYLTRRFISAMEKTSYFSFNYFPKNEQDAEDLLATGKAQFIINIPPNFTNDLIRGEKPDLLITADATDSVAIGSALSAIQTLAPQVFNLELQGALSTLKTQPSAFNLITHAKYNPENITQYNIVPGLIGVVLTMTMVVITSMAITKERERGTMETLLATPIHPLEVMIGKITPYIIVGYIQLLLIILAAEYLFDVPFAGSILLLFIATFPFILANLAVGLTFSTLAQNQLQASQMAFFFFLPSILLSGFMFPFYGMPQWAQWIGKCLPLSYYLKIVRGIMLKGNGLPLVMQNLWPILLFALIALFVSVKRYRRTLD